MRIATSPSPCFPRSFRPKQNTGRATLSSAAARLRFPKRSHRGLPIPGEVSSYKLVLVFGRERSWARRCRSISRSRERIRAGSSDADSQRSTNSRRRRPGRSALGQPRYASPCRERVRATRTDLEGNRIRREFGVIIRDPGTGTEPKTAFVGYEMNVAGAPTSLVKLQLQKDENGWRVANALPSDQIDDAHPLDTTSEGRPARRSPEAVAGKMLEVKLQREQLMSTVRSTYVCCLSAPRVVMAAATPVTSSRKASAGTAICRIIGWPIETRVGSSWERSGRGEGGSENRCDREAGTLDVWLRRRTGRTQTDSVYLART